MLWGKKTVSVDVNVDNIEHFLTRGVEGIFPSKEFIKEKMSKGERLTMYLGVDPTSPHLHIGHLIPIRKLAEFQKLGHQVVFLAGDFTATIGDPDKLSTRKPLTRKEILANVSSYQKQVSRFIDFSGPNKALFKFNSTWLSKMTFEDVLNLSSKVTVDQMLKRDMFKKRIEEGRPIYVHEFMYPLMQGYDSVVMDVDGEIGGNDQTFNMLVGRDLMKLYSNKEKFVIAMKLLTDPTGKKMGKSEGNMITLSQTPEDMFGKVMSWPDSMIVGAFEILTDVSNEKIKEIEQKLSQGENPRDIKVFLAQEIITICHSQVDALEAFKQFEKTFVKKEIPDSVTQIALSENSLQKTFVSAGVVSSNTEYRRLVSEEAITFMPTGEKVTLTSEPHKGVYKIGKRRFIDVK
jgi:tyrosyl-tRNA synthetase